MKRKKINKAIKTLRKFCDTRPDDCSGCPFKVMDEYGDCKFETIPSCWKTLKKEKKKND